MNRCLKNFNLSSMMGCPEKKFPPVGNAGYAPDITLNVGVSNPDCCGKTRLAPGVDAQLRPVHTKLTAGQVAAQFAKSMIEWKKQGFPLVSEAVHSQRYQSGCQKCPHYRYFLCQKCMCVSFLKTKLATQTCPDNPPRWV